MPNADGLEQKLVDLLAENHELHFLHQQKLLICLCSIHYILTKLGDQLPIVASQILPLVRSTQASTHPIILMLASQPSSANEQLHRRPEKHMALIYVAVDSMAALFPVNNPLVRLLLFPGQFAVQSILFFSTPLPSFFLSLFHLTALPPLPHGLHPLHSILRTLCYANALFSCFFSRLFATREQ